MRKRLCNKDLRSPCRRPTRQRGFSLAELVVAIGILVLMFSLAGQVFNVTIQSTGQAKALTEVSQLLRAFEQTLREDLRQVQPGQSVILIQGNPVNAYWTRKGKEADDDQNRSRKRGVRVERHAGARGPRDRIGPFLVVGWRALLRRSLAARAQSTQWIGVVREVGKGELRPADREDDPTGAGGGGRTSPDRRD